MPNGFNIKQILELGAAVLCLAISPVGHGQDIEAARDAAYAAQSQLLAPDLYAQAEAARTRATKEATDSPGRAAEASRAAVTLYRQANALAQQRALLVKDALTARDLALAANANNPDNEFWEDGENSLEKAIAALDRGRAQVAGSDAAEAAAYFDAAELQALQDNALRVARERLIAAEKLRAQRYAPVTLQRGYDLAADAKAVLEQDRTQLDRANAISRMAQAYADRAIQISQQIREKPSYEELILAWESRLDQALQATGKDVPVSLDPQVRSATLTKEIERLTRQEIELSSQLMDSQQFIAALEDEIRELDDRLGGASADRRALIMQFEAQARATEQLEQAKATFTQDEAQVFTQSGNIVVRLIGLKFASGSSRLPANGETLLQKLAAVIDIYPNSTLVLEGHTDSQGGDSGNEQLSQARADAVLNELVGKLRVPALRISSIGYGESRPIANNETANGRAQNRRIDLLITPAVTPTTF